MFILIIAAILVFYSSVFILGKLGASNTEKMAISFIAALMFLIIFISNATPSNNHDYKINMTNYGIHFSLH